MHEKQIGMESIKPETADAFTARMRDMMAGSMTVLCLSVGAHTGIIDLLTGYTEPKTCRQIAHDARCKPRYVQEWLIQMVTSRILDVSTESGEEYFFLPQSRRQVLAKSGKDMAGFADFLPVYAGVHNQLMGCFPLNGPSGISLDDYNGFHEYRRMRMQQFMQTGALQSVLDEVPNLIESMGNGISICEIGCSAGDFSLHLAKKYPNTQIDGFDIGESAIEMAQREVSAQKLTNIHFTALNIYELPVEWTDKFDFVFMVDVLHDLPNVSGALQAIWRMMKPGTFFSMVEPNVKKSLISNVGNVRAQFVSGCSVYNCVPTSLVFEGSEARGAMMGYDTILQLLEEANFKEVRAAKELDLKIHLLARK